jgi:hypothetical protein
LVLFFGVARAALRELFNEAAGGGRGVEKQSAGRFAAGVLPGVRDITGSALIKPDRIQPYGI